MTHNDWAFNGNRNAEARERILATATELISRDGFQDFSVDVLAERLHCSPATVYRRAGGKAAILEAVIARFSARIIKSVNESIDDLQGTERVVGAILVGWSTCGPNRSGG